MTAVLSRETADFYVVGGTMRHDSPSYVERQADKELFSALRRGEFCHVLTARQMGKSSLMLRTAARLRDCGVGVAVLDLTGIGQNLTPEQWYGGLVLQLGERLKLEDELLDHWQENMRLGPMQRWVETIRKVVLPMTVGQLVIFIDEIDAVRSLSFSTDEFFAGIRECHNLRHTDSEMLRLTFCLIGVATPADLIRDTRTTPFNIGVRIELNDFTQAEALPLADGLRLEREKNRAILNRILYWTSGHPYLTQRICQAAVQSETTRRTADVDRQIDELFFSKRAHDYDDNLIFVRERLLRSGADLTALLNLYARVRRGKKVHDVDSDPLVPILRLSGVTRAQGGFLRVRNRIYLRVFDKAWVTANLPDFEIRRQREAYRRGVWRTTIVSAIILSIVVSLALVALWQRNNALNQAQVNRRLLYTTRMKLVNQEWENANVSRVEELLQATRPQPGDEDMRGFEWALFYKDTHREIFRLDGLGSVHGVRFLKDGDTLAIGLGSISIGLSGRENKINLYNWKSRMEVLSFKAATKARFDVIVFSPDQKYVATDTPENRIAIWDLSSGTLFENLGSAQKDSLRAVTFAADAPYLASGDGAGLLRIWNLQTQQPEWTKKVGDIVNDVTFSPDGGLLAVTTSTDTVQLLDVRTRRMVDPFSIKHAILNHAYFSPDGNTLAVTAQDGNLYIWDIPTRRLSRLKISHAKEITTVAFSPDEKTLATGSVDRTVKIWDTANGNMLQLIQGHGSDVNSLDWSSDGRLLLTGGRDGAVKIWDTFAEMLPVRPKQPVKTYCATVFSPDDHLLALGIADDSHVKIWDLSTGHELSDLGKQEEILISVFSKDARFVAISYGRNLVEIYEVYTGNRIKRLPRIDVPVKGLTFSPDGRMLVTGSDQTQLRLWEVQGDRDPELLDSGNSYYCAAFSPDGNYLASADGDGAIRLWDIASLRIVKTLKGHTGMIRSIAFSPDGRLMASGSDDNTVRLWDIRSGTGIANPAQADSIFRIAFTVDGRRLVTGGRDGSIVLWNTTDMQEVLMLKGFSKQISSLTFSANGGNLAASSQEGKVQVWQSASMDESGINPR